MGESNRILVIKIICVSATSENPLNKILETNGVRKYARVATTIIKSEKKENILSMKLRSVSRPSVSFSIINGMSTDKDTIEATVTKIKSGIRKAA